MKSVYDKHYQTENLFGKPFYELIEYYKGFSKKGKLIDIGCGQGRNAVPLAEIGFQVTEIDNSEVGITQMLNKAHKKNVRIDAHITDIYKYADYKDFDFFLLDSMFHFQKKDRLKELKLIDKIITDAKENSIITFCIQNTGKKIDVLNEFVNKLALTTQHLEKDLVYIYTDEETNHSSETPYKILSFKKLLIN